MWGTTITIVLLSFAPFVLTQNATTPPNNYTACSNSTEIKEKNNEIKTCFKNIVNKHLDSAYHEDCTIPKLEQNIKAHWTALNATCGQNFLYINTTTFMKYIEFSLSNQTFKEFYGDLNCVKTLEKNITACVVHNVRHININERRKHSYWFQKMDLAYAKRNCDKNTMIKECVLKVLSTCKPSTSKYVSSLFDLAHSQCSNFKNLGSNAAAATPPSSHTTLIIISSLVGVVLLIIAGVLIWIKIKK
ncbi:uncharacterized protein LOC118282303 [Spodoptera frugiperda]|uniref:Uncharacterized protein LOC118282303 n=1 Tax=Spodoptera frugiperda TaxID=7108 RepID=A0A9R0E1N1_SPOFR|nr:uncharacterized protein LOC118282303 [Spodoptera frugiperda]